MNILQVTHRYAPDIGGVETHVQSISEQFVTQGHSVTVVTMSQRVKQITQREEGGINVVRLPSIGAGHNYRFSVALLRFLQKHKNEFDIVHAHNYHASPLLLTVLAHPPKLVLTSHFNDQPHSRVASYIHHPYKMIGRWALHQANAIVCVSEAERHRVEVNFGIASAKIHVVPNGVDAERLNSACLRVERDPFLVLCIGRLEAYKQVHRLIESVALLPEPFRLAVIGDGPCRKALQELVVQLGIENRVQFLGRTSDAEVLALYHRAGVAANLSSAEAFGLTVLEAVASGCPVLCSDIPAFQDLANLFPQHVKLQSDLNPHAVSSSIRKVASSAVPPPPDMSSYTWQNISAKLCHLYFTVLEHSGARSNERAPCGS